MLRSLRPLQHLCVPHLCAPHLCAPHLCPPHLCAPRRRLSSPRGSPVLPLPQRLLIAAAAAGAAAAGWLYLRQEKEQQRRARRLRELRALSLSQGDFQLRDTAGTPRSKSDFLGSWVLLYFGFTHCPDVCPEQLERLSRALQLLEREPALPPLQPLFVTVDPGRDGPEELARYLREFHPRLLGLTGTEGQVKEAAAAFRVYLSVGPRDADGDYLVDHSVLTFLLDPEGVLRDCYGRSGTAEEMAASVRGHMGSYGAGSAPGAPSPGAPGAPGAPSPSAPSPAPSAPSPGAPGAPRGE